jgi:hypothetical protein
VASADGEMTDISLTKFQELRWKVKFAEMGGDKRGGKGSKMVQERFVSLKRHFIQVSERITPPLSSWLFIENIGHRNCRFWFGFFACHFQ